MHFQTAVIPKTHLDSNLDGLSLFRSGFFPRVQYKDKVGHNVGTVLKIYFFFKRLSCILFPIAEGTGIFLQIWMKLLPKKLAMIS